MGKFTTKIRSTQSFSLYFFRTLSDFVMKNQEDTCFDYLAKLNQLVEDKRP